MRPRPRYMKSKSRSVILDERVARRLHADTRPLLVGSPDGWQDVYFEDGSFRTSSAWSGAGRAMGTMRRRATRSARRRWPTWTPSPGPTRSNPGRHAGPARTGPTAARGDRLRRGPLACRWALSTSASTCAATSSGSWTSSSTPSSWTPCWTGSLIGGWHLAGAVLDEVGPYVDVVAFGDDVAFHDRPMVDLDRYRRLFKPRHQQMIDLLKAKIEWGQGALSLLWGGQVARSTSSSTSASTP